jgi:hypothetical protein
MTGTADEAGRTFRAIAHDLAAAVLAAAVEDGVITDTQRIALLENWLAWGDRRPDERARRSQDDAKRIRDRLHQA